MIPLPKLNSNEKSKKKEKATIFVHTIFYYHTSWSKSYELFLCEHPMLITFCCVKLATNGFRVIHSYFSIHLKGGKNLSIYGKKLETYYLAFFSYSKEMQKLASWRKLSGILDNDWILLKCPCIISFQLLIIYYKFIFLLWKDDWYAANLAHI
jgi:hypothetical protein